MEKWQALGPSKSLYARDLLARTRSELASQLGLAISAAPRKAGRNGPCPCGSGKKFKKCCGA
ncbi:MAG: SEC-C metal-binding domain-containing protein [Limisphaerales bacterium]